MRFSRFGTVCALDRARGCDDHSKQGDEMSKCSKTLAGMSAVAMLAGCIGSAQAGLLLNEGFGTVVPAGWVATNHSNPVGSEGWFQGNTGVFSAQAGAANSYAAANLNSADVGGNISNWL